VSPVILDAVAADAQNRDMARPLKVGIQLPEVEREVRWAELRRMCELAERIGLDSIWVGDHLLYRGDARPARGPWEVWSTLAAVAAVTERVEIGPLVASTSFHNPAMLAKKAATIDEISGGRLVLGLGAGWNEVEYRAFGFPFDHRVSRFEEAFTIIRTLLATGRCDFRGTYYELDDCELIPRGPRPSGPPLLIGSNGERMLEIALPHVSSWNAWWVSFGNTVAGYLPLRDRIDAACVAAGRDPGDVERTLALFVRFDDLARGQASGRRMPDEPPIGGDPGSLVPALRAFAAEGVGHVQFVLDPITLDSIAALEPTLAALDADGT
jgi:alkanesulfonate monooxygenase SsuD/methylene tetrahydromethanopterin reductase-like flavin-dependent oxidoreductase (luciferase family)